MTSIASSISMWLDDIVVAKLELRPTADVRDVLEASPVSKNLSMQTTR